MLTFSNLSPGDVFALGQGGPLYVKTGEAGDRNAYSLELDRFTCIQDDELCVRRRRGASVFLLTNGAAGIAELT